MQKGLNGILRLKQLLRSGRKMISTYGVALFLLFLAFSALSLYLLRANMLNASHDVGMQLTKRISISAAAKYQKEEDFIRFLADFAEELTVRLEKENAPKAQINQALTDFALSSEEKLRQALPGIKLHLFMIYKSEVVDHQFVEPKGYDLHSREWYQLTAAHPGRVMMSPPYTDLTTGKQITTAAITQPETELTLGCDIYLDQMLLSNMELSDLPEGYCAYILDNEGNVLYYQHNDGIKHSYEDIIASGDEIFQAVMHYQNQHKLKCSVDDPIADECFIFDEADSGPLFERAAYYCIHTGSSWHTIVTAPVDVILQDFHAVLSTFIGLLVLFICLELWMLKREYSFSQEIQSSSEALKVLGNSFRDIVRVNFRDGNYSLLKACPYFKELLHGTSSYTQFMAAMQTIIHPDHWPEFAREYSLKNLEHLAVNYIRDLGHDYQIIEEKNGRYVWFNVRILFDESLDVYESLISFKQVDAEKIKEIEEHQLLKDTLEMSRRNEIAKNTFFANMSHDMRTPLNGILGLCQLAEHKKGDAAELENIIRRINLTSGQLLLLVDDILEVSRPEMQQSLTPVPFDLRTFLTSNLDVFRVMAEQSQRSFAIKFDIRHSQVVGDCQKLRQVLNNLISNSFKYSNDGAHIECLIKEVYEQETYTKFIFEVSDDGIGMEEDFVKQLFTPYQREERMKDVVGTGLGLSIVKNLVQLMGGDIQVKSTVNVGTVFTITLPLALQHAPQVHTAEKSSSKTEKESLLNGLTILIAEDNELNMDIACDMLQLRGVTTIKAWNGQEAFELFRDSDPYTIDAILMDMRMPKLDGCAAATAIRALPRMDAKDIPILAITANAFAEDIAATHAAGMNAHVSKPIDFDLVEKTISRLVSRRNNNNNKNEEEG